MPTPEVIATNDAGTGRADEQSFDERKRREFRDYLEGEWDKKRIAFLTMRSAMRRRRMTFGIVGGLLAILGVALFIGGYQDWLLYEGAVVILGIIFGGVALFLRVRGRFPEQPELEQELDRCVRSDRERLLKNADVMVAHVGDTRDCTRFVLNGYPDKEQLGTEPRAGRIGSDRRVRITPFAFFVLNVGSETVTTYACVVDILTGQSLYEQVRDFAYSNIAAITRTVSSQPAVGRRAAATREKDQDALSINLVDGSNFTIVLRDNAFVDSWLGTSVPALVDEQELSAVWQTLRGNWFAVTAKPAIAAV